MDFFETLDRLYAEASPDKIESFLLDSLAEAKADANYALAVSILNEAGGFYRGCSRFSEACECFSQALKIMEDSGMSGSASYATILLNYAGNLRLLGDLESAEKTFISAKNMLENAGAHKGYEYISLLNNLSLLYKDQGRTDEALETAEKVLNIVRRTEDNEHELATTLNNLAAMYMGAGSYGKALPLLNEALDIFDAMPYRNVHQPSALASMAALKAHFGDVDEALALLERSAELTEQIFGNNIDYAKTLCSMGSLYARKNMYDKALSLQLSAAKLYAKLTGEDSAFTRQAESMLESYKSKATFSE